MHDQIQKEEEEEEEEEEPPEEARKREEVVSGYEKMWDQFKNVHKVIGACERVFVVSMLI